MWDDGEGSLIGSDEEEEDSDRSWQTESGEEEDDNGHDSINSGSLASIDVNDKSQLKTRLVANIEKARIAMSRLEEIFIQNPAMQTTQVMKQLLDCYKECR